MTRKAAVARGLCLPAGWTRSDSEGGCPSLAGRTRARLFRVHASPNAGPGPLTAGERARLPRPAQLAGSWLGHRRGGPRACQWPERPGYLSSDRACPGPPVFESGCPIKFTAFIRHFQGPARARAARRARAASLTRSTEYGAGVTVPASRVRRSVGLVLMFC